MAYNDKSAKICIKENDFISALENLLHTTKRWQSYWYNCCITIMENDSQWKTEYEPDPKCFKFYPVVVRDNFHSIWFYKGKEILTNGDVNLLDEANQKCYLFRFFNSKGKLVCSKVGTTTKPILIRIKSELREYEKLDVCTCVVDRVYDCGKYPAEGMESYFRAKYIRKHPEAYRKNDRFFSVTFDLDEADRIYTEFFA